MGDRGVRPRAAIEPARSCFGSRARRPAEARVGRRVGEKERALKTAVPERGFDSTDIYRLQQRGLFAAVGGLAVGLLGALLQPAQFLPSWLIGFMFCTGLSLGCLALLMVQHMTSGAWGLVTRRLFEAGARLLPYCALLFIPIAAGAPSLYLWARPEAVAADEILQHKHAYLNWPFFV